MSNIAIFGANGRMGRVLIEAVELSADDNLTAAGVRATSSLVGADVGELAGIGKKGLLVSADLSANIQQIDVLIDFTLPAALNDNLAFCVAHKKPIIIGTTGLNAEQKSLLDSAAKVIPIVFAANYSVGVNLMLNLVRKAIRQILRS